MTAGLRHLAVNHVLEYLVDHEQPDWVVSETFAMLQRTEHWGQYLVVNRSNLDAHEWCDTDDQLRDAIGNQAAAGGNYCRVNVARIVDEFADGLTELIDNEVDRCLQQLFPAHEEVSPSAVNTRAANDQSPTSTENRSDKDIT